MENKKPDITSIRTFAITKQEWQLVYTPDKLKLESEYTNLFYNKLVEKIRQVNASLKSHDLLHTVCPIAFKACCVKKMESQKTKAPIVNVKAKCLDGKCPRYYKFLIAPNEDLTKPFINIKVFTFDEPFHLETTKMYKRKNTLSQYKRVGKAINENGLDTYLTNVINQHGEECALSNNYTLLPSKASLRVAAYRERQSTMLSQDSFVETKETHDSTESSSAKKLKR